MVGKRWRTIYSLLQLTIISIFVGLARLFMMRARTPWSQGHPFPPRALRSCQKMENAFLGGGKPFIGSRTIFTVHPIGMHLPVVPLEIVGYWKRETYQIIDVTLFYLLLRFLSKTYCCQFAYRLLSHVWFLVRPSIETYHNFRAMPAPMKTEFLLSVYKNNCDA